MILRRTISLACPIMCTICLAAGHAAHGWGIVVMAGASTGLAWWLANKWPATALPSAALVISIACGAAGLLTSAPALLMILGATFALASWDLVLFNRIQADNPISSTPTIALFQNRHYRSLALALGFGASAVLVYGAIKSPLAQPRNLVGGHMISGLIGVACHQTFGWSIWLAAAMAVSLAIVAMLATKTLHPPGGATALIAVIGGAKVHNLGFLYAFCPAGAGAVVLLVVALLVNNLSRNRKYPEYWF